MKITQVSLTVGRTHSLGNYCSQRFEVSLTAELEDGDDAIGALGDLRSSANLELECSFAPYKPYMVKLQPNAEVTT